MWGKQGTKTQQTNQAVQQYSGYKLSRCIIPAKCTPLSNTTFLVLTSSVMTKRSSIPPRQRSRESIMLAGPKVQWSPSSFVADTILTPSDHPHPILDVIIVGISFSITNMDQILVVSLNAILGAAGKHRCMWFASAPRYWDTSLK